MGGAVGIRRPKSVAALEEVNETVVSENSPAMTPLSTPLSTTVGSALSGFAASTAKQAQQNAQRKASTSSCGPRFRLPRDNSISALTWNVAAVNNNPFEYWIDYTDPLYVNLMQGVEEFLENPGENDCQVCECFSDEMFTELLELMRKAELEGVDEIEEKFWRGGSLHLRNRKVVTEFMLDGSLGAKRLISMPDRVTNTINIVTRVESTYRPPPACRPTVINNYEGDLSTLDIWWDRWKHFMFTTAVTVRTRVGTRVQTPVEMLEPISRRKYPAVTEEEERLAIPLQLVCQAIFDAILVSLMNRLSPDGGWQQVKSKICDRLYKRKHERTMEILANSYGDVDIMCLQEVAAVFKDRFQESSLGATHELIIPQRLDGKRDQNSMVILRKDTFDAASIQEVTQSVAAHNSSDMTLADGDLCAIEARCLRDERYYVIMSFHGDTNGLLTNPVMTAFHRTVQEKYADRLVIACLDANVYHPPESGKVSFMDFAAECRKMGLTFCFGDDPCPDRCFTTCSARTSLQPQLNKAVRFRDRVDKSDNNPKDIIVFYRSQLALSTPEVPPPFESSPTKDGESAREVVVVAGQPNPVKDNTGRLLYKENSIFPTLEFPSDHGIVAVSLRHTSPRRDGPPVTVAAPARLPSR